MPPARDADGPVVLASDPMPGDVDVDRAASFRVFFDRPVLPRDVRRGRVVVRSGGRSAFLSAWFDPVERVMHVENLLPPLDPDVGYRLVVEGVRDLERRPMADAYTAPFTTGAEARGTPTPLAGWADVAPILARCAADGCHGGATPALGLDLSSGAGVEATAIGVAARQTRVGTQDDTVWSGASTLDGLARIDVVGGVGRPSRSYLLYKVIGDPHAAGSVMPPPPDDPLTADEQGRLSRWIRAGAPTL